MVTPARGLFWVVLSWASSCCAPSEMVPDLDLQGLQQLTVLSWQIYAILMDPGSYIVCCLCQVLCLSSEQVQACWSCVQGDWTGAPTVEPCLSLP